MVRRDYRVFGGPTARWLGVGCHLAALVIRSVFAWRSKSRGVTASASAHRIPWGSASGGVQEREEVLVEDGVQLLILLGGEEPRLDLLVLGAPR